MRQLTHEEIKMLAEEIDELEAFNMVKAFAHRWYGPNAHKVEIETYPESDDEGGSYYTIDAINVYDGEGSEVPCLIDAEDEDDPDDYWEEKYKLPCDEVDRIYILDEPPTLSFPQVFVEE